MPLIYSPTQKVRKTVAHSVFLIPYFSAHHMSKPNPNPNPNSNPNPNPDNSPDHDCSHLLVRDAVVRNAVGRKGGHRSSYLFVRRKCCLNNIWIRVSVILF